MLNCQISWRINHQNSANLTWYDKQIKQAIYILYINIRSFQCDKCPSKTNVPHTTYFLIWKNSKSIILFKIPIHVPNTIHKQSKYIFKYFQLYSRLKHMSSIQMWGLILFYSPDNRIIEMTFQIFTKLDGMSVIMYIVYPLWLILWVNHKQPHHLI